MLRRTTGAAGFLALLAAVLLLTVPVIAAVYPSVTVNVALYAPAGNPIGGAKFYLVMNGGDTAHAIKSATTGTDGQASMSANITDGTYFVVADGPIVYDYTTMSNASTYSFTFYLNRTDDYANITVRGFIDDLPDTAVRVNVTITDGALSVKVVDAHAWLNTIYFRSGHTSFRAVLDFRREISKLGFVYSLKNVTIEFVNGTKRAYNTTSVTVDPFGTDAVKSVKLYYKGTGTFMGLSIWTWIAIGAALVGAGTIMAIMRGRKAAASVIGTSRRGLRRSDDVFLGDVLLETEGQTWRRKGIRRISDNGAWASVLGEEDLTSRIEGARSLRRRGLRRQ